ncbi:MAG TPA: ABC transporter substrate-binding protein [Clostridia bacterium]|nr:ABC transporter substrate-binding protein [Clostridia bacterium]
MFPKKRIHLILILLVAILLLVGGCSDGNSSGSTNDKGQKVVRMAGGDYGLLQPYTNSQRGPGKFRTNLIFEKLIDKDEQGIIPWLAKGWKIENEGKRIIFDLREDVKWQDGEPFSAEDVLFTFNYIKDYPQIDGDDMMIDEDFLQVRQPNDYQVEFILSDFKADFIERLYTISILPKHIWEGVGAPDKFVSEEALIGTGPYKLTDYKKEHGSYRLEANREFWGPKPAADVLEFVPVSDPVLAFINGDIDIADIPVDLLDRFEGNPRYTIMEKPGIVWAYRMRINMESTPEFKTRELRQALAYAIDRQELVDKVARGAGVVGSMGILPAGHVWANPSVPPYDRNIETAKGLLGKAHLDGKELAFELIVGDEKEVRMGELIKEQLEDMGIEIKIISLDGKARDNKIIQGDYQLAIVGHGGWARDPEYLSLRFSSTKGDLLYGTPGYVNQALQNLLTAQSGETNEEVRREMVNEIQEILAEDVPEIPLYFTTDYLVYDRDKYDGWMHICDHHEPTHNKLSFLERR